MPEGYVPLPVGLDTVLFQPGKLVGPGPLLDGWVNLSSSDATGQGLTPALLRLPESQGRLRNGAYVGQWWLFAAFTLFMAFRIARDIGIDEAEVAEITPERPSEST